MRKRISFLLVAVLLLATLIPALPIFAADETTGGETVANTFNADDANPKISTAADYIAFFNAVWKDGKGFDGKTVTLLQNITFNDTKADNWYAQAGVTKLVSYDDAQWRTFNGNFDGGNHTLEGVIVEGRFTAGGAGIFPGMAGSIKNLNVDGFYVCATESRFGSWLFGRVGIGGLVGVAVGSLTVDGCTLNNGIVTAAKNVNGTVGALVGSHQISAKADVKVIDSTVSDVQLLKGESSCEVFGGIWGNLYPSISSGASCIDLSGSYFKAIEGIQPVGVCALSGDNLTPVYYFKNAANGFSAIGSDNGGLQRTFVASIKKAFPDDTKRNEKGQYGDNTEKANTAISELGCYGVLPTVKLVGTQPGKNTSDVRFVGLVAKSVIDDKTIDSLGFRLTVGETTVDESQISCTKVYTSILENGVTRTAPEGYYFFTFVVTGVDANTEFTYSAVAKVGDKVCFTTDGGYTYSPASAAPSES